METDVFNDGRQRKVLVFVTRINENGKKEVLMGMHPKQHKRNFPGGAIGDRYEIWSETPKEAAIREVKEETGFDIEEPKKLGKMTFKFPDGNHIDLSIFISDKWTETDEKSEGLEDLQWYETDKLPYNEMWETDRVWLPFALQEYPFEGSMTFSEKEGYSKFVVQNSFDNPELRVV
ncbi:MAG: NUDIX domain-containing protein [Candidatus Dojkabacteria bacterium]|nr:NUDIX domain-containing protein [Candidatus Dojkabacteria bacterium]